MNEHQIDELCKKFGFKKLGLLVIKDKKEPVYKSVDSRNFEDYYNSKD